MRLLLVFLKEPIPGKVKTRLAADVGDDEAARYYKAMVEILLKQLRGLQDCQIRFCYAPDDAGDAIRFWLLSEMGATSSDREGVYLAPVYPSSQKNHQEIDFRAQGEGDLGDRLERAFAEAFADGFTSTAVIGTDCPSCGARWINASFSRLESDPQRNGVIGPSHDGGYYLLALQSPAPCLFQEISWGESKVLRSTLNAAEKNKIALTQLPELADVDHLADWEALLDSPLGPAVRKALGENLEEDDSLPLSG
ncbi:MAG: DUF2064 domain-containing protein [Akkermansiaceae bacterium]